jgi:hypothetical protein
MRRSSYLSGGLFWAINVVLCCYAASFSHALYFVQGDVHLVRDFLDFQPTASNFFSQASNREAIEWKSYSNRDIEP